jgi:hypothetical protein
MLPGFLRYSCYLDLRDLQRLLVLLEWSEGDVLRDASALIGFLEVRLLLSCYFC